MIWKSFLGTKDNEHIDDFKDTHLKQYGPVQTNGMTDERAA